MVRLKREVEKAKIELSAEDYAEIELQGIAGVKTFTYTLMRRKFEQLCDPIWKKYVELLLKMTALFIVSLTMWLIAIGAGVFGL